LAGCDDHANLTLNKTATKAKLRPTKESTMLIEIEIGLPVPEILGHQ
jgi:hypothetical protein